MTETAAVDRLFGETRLALLDRDGRLVELHHFRDEDALRPGDIHRGRVIAAAPALGGAFVELAGDRVLLKAAPSRIPPEGGMVILQIRHLARPPKLATAILCDPPGDHDPAGPPALLQREAAPWIAVLDARGPDRIESLQLDDPDLKRVAEALPWLGDRTVMTRKPVPLFTRLGIEEEIDHLLDASVTLPGGGRITIEPTQALTAIDVDTGTASTGRDARSVARAVNARAAAEIARQLRLRRIGGLVVVDFLRLRNPKDREELLTQFTAALSQLPWPHACGRFSRFGLLDLEITHAGRDLATEIAAPGLPDRFNLETLARRAIRAALATAGHGPGQPVVIASRDRALTERITAICPTDAFARLAGAPLEIRMDETLDSRDFETYLRSKG